MRSAAAERDERIRQAGERERKNLEPLNYLNASLLFVYTRRARSLCEGII